MSLLSSHKLWCPSGEFTYTNGELDTVLMGLLQDINARDSPPKKNKPLRIFSIIGSVIAMLGLLLSIVTFLGFK